MSDVLKTHKNQTVVDMYKLLEKELKPLDAMQAKVKAAMPRPVAELDKELSESTDPKLVEFREAIERIEEQLRVAREDAHNHMRKDEQTLSDDELEKLKTAYGQQYNRAKKAWGMLNDFASMMPNTDGVTDALKEITIPNLRNVGKTTGSVGDGTARPRITSVTIVRKDGSSKVDERISSLVTWSKLKTQDIYAAWYAAAGTDNWKNITETHTFKVDDCEVTIEPHVNGEDE